MRMLRPVETAVFLLAWLVPWRPAFRTRASKSKLSFFAHCRDISGRHVAKYGAWEPRLTDWISDHLSASPPGIFVDVGANLGWHAIHAAQHARVEAVVAFEPDAFNAWLLDRNLTLNDINKVIINVCAVGARCGTIRLNRYKSSNKGRHSVLTEHGYGWRTVPMTDLDSALDAVGFSDRRVLALKMDVEGYEPAVIAGAKQTLARTDAVIIEYSPDLSRSGGLSPLGMLDGLQAAGFTPHMLEDEGPVREVPLDELRSLSGQVDVIWIRKK
jgi:FkbM family methyltransferase